jgi:hypothetical protein
MEDLNAKLEKLLVEAEDCERIGGQTTNIRKRALFEMLATNLRKLADQVQAVIVSQTSRLRK